MKKNEYIYWYHLFFTGICLGSIVCYGMEYEKCKEELAVFCWLANNLYHDDVQKIQQTAQESGEQLVNLTDLSLGSLIGVFTSYMENKTNKTNMIVFNDVKNHLHGLRKDECLVHEIMLKIQKSIPSEESIKRVIQIMYNTIKSDKNEIYTVYVLGNPGNIPLPLTALVNRLEIHELTLNSLKNYIPALSSISHRTIEDINDILNELNQSIKLLKIACQLHENDTAKTI